MKSSLDTYLDRVLICTLICRAVKETGKGSPLSWLQSDARSSFFRHAKSQMVAYIIKFTFLCCESCFLVYQKGNPLFLDAVKLLVCFADLSNYVHSLMN